MLATRFLKGLAALALCALAAAQAAAPSAGLGKVVVRGALGGIILGYDIDQNGTQGLLTEYVPLADGNADVAVETFDQATGQIIKIVRQKKDSKSDYVSLGIVGNHVGLVEFEHVTDLFVDKRVYHLMDPLDSNDFTGRWTPPFKKASDIITSASTTQGSPETTFLGFKNTGSDFSSYIFTSNVGANTFGPVIPITDTDFDWNHSPVMAMDTVKYRAVLGSSLGCFGCHTRIRVVDLATGEQHSFGGLGLGYVNGIAVDSNTGIACTTTEDDFSVEFYDLDKGTAIIVKLPGATSQAQSGGAVAVDPLHKLFLVGQEFSSTAAEGSSIHVYDEKGNLVKSLNGFSLPASPAYMALNPSQRKGFVIVTPGLDALQSFKY